MASGPSIQLPLTTLPLNTMTPYVRAHVEVADSTLHWDSWWTVLGFLPVRRDRLSTHLASVSASRSRVGIHWDRLIVGVALATAALLWVRGWMAILALAGAGLMWMMAPTAQLCVSREGARERRLSVCIRHKFDVDLIAMALDDLTGRGAPRTRPRTHPTDRPDAGPLTT
jgi:hypothetical protein